MEWEMWRRVLSILVFVGMGGRRVEGNGANKDIFEKLCNITKGVKGLMGRVDGDTELFREALYGETGKASFDKDGVLTGGCGWLGGPDHRSQYCSHIEGGVSRGSGKHGCFGHSLVGTVLCTCVPGQREQKDLCGLGSDAIDKGVWTSGTDGHVTTLLKDVWDKINRKCTKNNTTVDLENLEDAVKGIKGETKQSNGITYVTLGGINSNGNCGGTSSSETCVTYPTKGGNAPDIPWVDKILEGITKLKVSKSQQQASTSSSGTQAENDQEDHEDPSDNAPNGIDGESEEEEGEEESVENPSSHNPSKTPRPKRKRRSTNKQPTEQPPEHLRAILHDDGSFLLQPFWLISAVFIF